LKFSLGALDELKVTVVMENSSLLISREPVQSRAGLSILLTARHRTTVWNTLLDVGPDPDALLGNLRTLGIAAQSINTVVLSHNHADHSLGLARVIGAIGKKNLPVVAHPAVERPVFVTGRGLRQIGLQPGDSLQDCREAGGVFILSREPIEIMPGLYTAGEIPRVTGYEAIELPVCTVDGRGAIAPDTIPDDQCLIAHVADKGLVLVTGCSHSGIINMCRHARALTGIEKIAGVIGGFHLMEGGAARTASTIEDFRSLEPGLLASGHCTGFDAEAEFAMAFGKTYRHMTVGSVYSF
jgi:7,8-dihydropterin-6-yl-methyl-4-(beta-D-ribofuranosyl)aminobenzene 5'-phosphate synthase